MIREGDALPTEEYTFAEARGRFGKLGDHRSDDEMQIKLGWRQPCYPGESSELAAPRHLLRSLGGGALWR